ncbi:MAG: MotA/TolQ/ExbB proton channel family protein [Arcobacteraceae bacterium]|nr:MotA/TolQ/ExbB proton channel family protein [Arcobacteraceae bacterium]
MSTLAFNIAVLTVLAIGMIIVYHAAFRLTMLAGTFGILAYKKGDQLTYYLKGIDRIMPASIAHMFYKRAQGGTLYFTQSEAKDVTAWLEDKFANQKSYIGFFTATALMIGLFGTFTGLLKAIDEMGGIILSLAGDINLAEVMAGFAGPLSGMAIGFGSSLFGVATAIILSIKAYILARNQETFIEDIEDWMKGKIIDTQSSEVIQQFHETVGGGHFMKASSGTGGGSTDIFSSSRFVDVLSESFGGLKEELKKSAEGNEIVYKMLSENLNATTKASGNEVAILESLVSAVKELNLNQYSNSNMLDESIQGLANIATSEHKTIKQLLELQKENQDLMQQFVSNFDTRLKNIENGLKK